MKEYFFKDLYINITATSTADGMYVQVQDLLLLFIIKSKN